MIDDDHRGYHLELIATKLLSIEDHAVQIVGMSATLTVGSYAYLALSQEVQRPGEYIC